mgnify:CR=1 FL=1
MSVSSFESFDGKRSVLGRVFDILECFADEPEQTISSLCARTDLPPATVHRMLASLTEWGAIERASRGNYRLGMRLWRLGWGVPQARRMRDVARPHLVDLHGMTGEVATVCSRDGNAIIVVDVIAGKAASIQWTMPRTLPFATSASGLVFTAFGPQIGDGASDGRADFALRQELHEIRRQGFAVSMPDRPGDPAWVAAPIMGELGQVRSTIALAVPSERLRPVPMGRVVAEAARAVSASLTVSVTEAL